MIKQGQNLRNNKKRRWQNFSLVKAVSGGMSPLLIVGKQFNNTLLTGSIFNQKSISDAKTNHQIF